MNSRQRILAVLRGSRADRIPWIPLTSQTFFASVPEYQAKFGAEDQGDYMPQRETFAEMLEDLAFRVSYRRSLGTDYMDWGFIAIPVFERVYDGVSIHTEGDGDRRVVHYQTPIGTLTQERVLSTGAKTLFPVTSLFKSAEDFKIYAYVLEHTRIVPLYDRVEACLETIGEAGVAFVAAPSAPIKDWILSNMLVEDLSYALVDHPQELRELEDLAHVKNLEMCRIQAASSAEVFIDFSVSGTGMISPSIYRDHYLDYSKEYTQIYHAQGKIRLDHTSGEPLRGILSMLAETGVDGLYGISLPEYGHGDADLREIRAALGPDVTLIASMEPHLLATASEQEVKEAAMYILDQCAQIGGRFMLGTADDLPFGTPPRNIAAVSEVVEKHGYGL